MEWGGSPSRPTEGRFASERKNKKFSDAHDLIWEVTANAPRHAASMVRF